MHLKNITFDAHDPQRLASFWAAATGNTLAASTAFFASLDPAAGGPMWLFLAVPENKTAKNRVHLDFHTADRPSEVARLVGLGATEHGTRTEWGVEWTVLRDPEGNEFCVAAD